MLLQVLTPPEETVDIALLGSHGEAGVSSADSWPQETLEGVAIDLQRVAKRPCGPNAGNGESLFAMLIETLKTQQGFKRALLERYLTKRKLDRFKQTKRENAEMLSPIPLQPSKRDCVLLAAGMPPLQYHNRRPKARQEERGLAVYLDVSGSVNEHLPKILGLLEKLRDNLETVYLFSTVVTETPFRKLLNGHIQTTYGTDFNCIAEHLVQKNLDLAVIITDGYSKLSANSRKHLTELGCELLTVLFGDMSREDVWSDFGEVVRLEDAIA